MNPTLALLLMLVSALVVTGILSAGLIVALMPWLKAHVLAHQNARSSHQGAIPQGGGLAVIAAMVVAMWFFASFWPALTLDQFGHLMTLTAALALLAALGAIDDIRGLPAW